MNSKNLFLSIIAFDIVLFVLHLLLGNMFDVFHLDKERTFSSYYDGLRLVGIAGFGVAIAFLESWKTGRVLWLCFSAIFIVAGFDEISELHENVAYYARYYLPTPSFFRSSTYLWLLILSPVLSGSIAFLFILSRRFGEISKKLRYCMVAGLACFLVALAAEFIGGIVASKQFLFWEVLLEEGMEKLGATFLLFTTIILFIKKFNALFFRRTGMHDEPIVE